MKAIKLLTGVFILALAAGCAPFDKIYSHEFSSGYFKLKSPGTISEKVYLTKTEDSITVYSLIPDRMPKMPDISQPKAIRISSVIPGSYLYNSTFVKTSLDADLSTVLLKFRPAAADVQPQLNTDVNGVLYAGFRKDFFKIKTGFSAINVASTFVRHTGFDFGFFAGIGNTFVSPTVTENKIIQEYNGIVFQKGFSVFGTFENMSVGLAIGFDNLLDDNKSIWIYNNKPWIGIVLGIANF
jgi:hypothetical protein